MKRIALIITTFMVFFQVSAQQSKEKPQVDIYGFLRLNATFDLKDMGGSDLFKPSAIPMQGGNNPNFFMTVKQTRIGIRVHHHDVSGVLEGDFHNTSSGPGGQLRIRQAYIKWKGFTIGQAWSTFYDIKARPHIVDFEGASSSTLNRAPLIRYESQWNKIRWNLALENPLEQVSISGNAEVLKQSSPDVLGALIIPTDASSSFVKIVGMARQLRYSNEEGNNKDELGWGALITGKQYVGPRNNVRYQLVTGAGIARYIEGVRGLGYDGVYNAATGNIISPNLLGGFVAWQNYWSDHWNSTFMVGTTVIEHIDLLESDDLKRGDYGLANIFYEDGPLAFGLEYLIGGKTTINDDHAMTSRIQFGSTWKF